MLKGYTLPKSPKGKSSLVPKPPWHYVGNVLAVTFEADEESIKGYLPEPLTLNSNKCCLYFIEWQYTSEDKQDFLDPITSQYKETILLMDASYRGKPLAYCPYIWVNQDKAFLRGLIQGWPKQLGQTHMTRAFDLMSPAAPGNIFGASFSSYERRRIDAIININEDTTEMPQPTFAGSTLLRYFPDLTKENHKNPMVNQLVQLKSRDVEVSKIKSGPASLEFYDHRDIELIDFKPTEVLKGYKFSVKLTVDDLKVLENL